ncbi:response regulator [Pseudomonas knackmussii]|uniref:Response regulator n=1 Tax=Pseudomonas knackmussii TaxID=65741 RepID=A0ABY4KNW9_9PSED|nr:response regulator [Pseudomonas knackmussii]UPQ80947.1 response regulator [Pseudomonas knackmussii]
MITSNSNVAAGRRLENMRVLVVEDEALVGMLLDDMLQDIGCESVQLASRFDEAMRAAEQEEFGLAVLDVNLDGVSSLPIADRLIELGIPLIFATGYGKSGLDSRYANIPTLQKPFFFADLERVVQQALTAS